MAIDQPKQNYTKDSTADHSMPRSEDLSRRIQQVPSEYSPPPTRNFENPGPSAVGFQKPGEGMPRTSVTRGEDGVTSRFQ